ncbi:hypothetical protein G9A89_015025 [Geosiphon pyriformis]|nr:hypothetical protein G9A89_015025 [Geosiphon pyriformis]
MPPSYTNAHRLFLQASIAERVFLESKGLEIYKRVCEVTKNMFHQQDFEPFLDTINKRLNSMDMEFRKSLDESTGEALWALVNTSEDEIAKLATEYTPLEISYFKILIDMIVRADDEAFSVSAISALRECSRVKPPMTKNAAEQLIQRFVDDKWLVKSLSGRYSMSPRTILELQNYLKQEFDDEIKECTLCFDIVTKGQRCIVQQCSVRLHQHCAQRYFSSQSEKVCPTCKANWRETMVVGSDSSPRISNKISTRKALSVVETTKQNVLEAFLLPSNHEKLSLIAIEATFSSLTGFLPVKVLSKRHTWISLSIASTPTKSPKVFNSRPVNKLVFPFIALMFGAFNTSFSKKIVKKTKSSEKWRQLFAFAIITPNPFVIETESSSSLVFGAAFAGWVASTLVSGATFKIKLAHVKTLFCMEFAFQVSLKAVFLIELTSSVCLATLKIAKFLVVSKSGSLSAAVALCNMSLNMSTINIKTVLSVFGMFTYVMLKSTKTIVSHDRFKTKLVNLLSGCTVFEISNMTCFVPWFLNFGCYFHFALIIFNSQADLDLVVIKTDTLKKCCHLAIDYKVALPPFSKAPKVFKPYFISFLSYVKTSVSPVFFEFSFLVASVFFVTVDNSLMSSWLVSLKSDLAKLSVLVKSIVKPVDFMIKIFEQFVNSDLVFNNKLRNRVNELMIHLGAFSKSVSKLERKVVALKTEYSMKNVDLFGDSGAPIGVSDEIFAEWFVGLVPSSLILFDIIQKMSILDKFSCKLTV